MPEAHEVPEPRGEGEAVSIGDVLVGKYRVDRVLGVGGMGVVLAATHVDLLEPRAIKLMRADRLHDTDSVARFLREARASARLKGDHVAKVHDVGKLDSGAPFIVMEHLSGQDLGALLEGDRALPVEEIASYVLQVCEALAEAHAAGIVHRDLKPENIFLAEGPGAVRTVKVLDFGISMVLQSDREVRMTKTSTIMGSPFFMSPEQARSSRDVDARADIWSLGVILYRGVTGRLPFDGENLTEILSAVLMGSAPRPSELVHTVPPQLDAVILRCLERDVARRYPSVRELAEDLAPFAPRSAQSSLETVRRLLGPAPSRDVRDVSDAGTLGGDPSGAQTTIWPGPRPDPYAAQRRRFALNIAAGVLLAITLGSAAAFLRPRHAAHPAATAEPSAADAVPTTARVAPLSAPEATAAAPDVRRADPAPPGAVATSAPVATPPTTSAAAGSPAPHPSTKPLAKPGPQPTGPTGADPFGAGRQ
jgi:serine/threonine-protein kinase